jgi:hypothetical protein
MRVIRVASVASLCASVLVAQQTTPVAAPQGGTLQAEVHFTTDGSTWFTTNMPAYVALFDVSRSGVTQLYPTFSAQARVPAGTFRDVAVRFPAPLPGGSALMPISIAPTGANYGWPHTLLLVASTAPLRVGNPVESNISLNNSLFQQHHFTDVETDAGIKAIIALVSPVDSYADVVTDQISSLPGSVRALASSATYDPNRAGVGYACTDANHTFYSVVAQLGANCTAVREVPPGLATPGFASPSSVAYANRFLDTSAAKPARAAASDGKTIISDPAAIRRFMESLRNGSSGAAAAGAAPGAARSVNAPPVAHAPDASRRSDANGGGRPAASPAPTTTPSAPKSFSAPANTPPAASASGAGTTKRPND